MNKGIFKYCGGCALRRQEDGLCAPFNKVVDEKESGCPLYTSELWACEVCGKQDLPTNLIINPTENSIHFICGDCTQGCRGCINSNSCAFQTDQSCPEPPFIVETVRQGNAIMQRQVPNIKRIKITCSDCPCYSPDSDTFCSKQQNIKCVNHKFPFEEVKN